ncbi:5-oxoprolinase subunit PxpB [Cohnella suwonensis]|uniref:5-oxoprolinase subunit PxpB n=1 Tax=Cohnella suwonensis TaxID=696072 RepID=A0ABW0LWH5_9BACL
MTNADISVEPLGDRAFLLRWAGEAAAARLASCARALNEAGLSWLRETVPAYRTIACHLRDGYYGVEEAAEEALRFVRSVIEPNREIEARLVELPTVYGGEAGPDLAECADRSDMTESEFATRHASATYEVALLGFAPGFPYLSGLDAALSQPRRASPRMKVPAGAIGIAGGQTGVYSVESPGGWQIIGRTTVPLFRPDAEPPFLLAPGDRVRFVAIEARGGGEGAAAIAVTDVAGSSDDQAEGAGGTDADSERSAAGNVALTVLKPGLLTTVQDLGRSGWQAYGVSGGGAMDTASLRKANLLVGNDEGAAALELTLIGGAYVAERDIVVAICGGDLGASADGSKLPMNRPVFLRQGTVLTFGTAASGCRAYVAVAGGIDVPPVLGSRATDARAMIGGGRGRALQAGDRIRRFEPGERAKALIGPLRRKAEPDGRGWSAPDWSASGWVETAPYLARMSGKRRILPIRLLPGAEWGRFGKEARELLFREAYRVETSSDRMGARLSGPAIPISVGGEMESHGVSPGTIQVPPGGRPIILAANCQPTGGYPKIANAIAADLPLLAQASPGDWLSFSLTDADTAERALKLRERELAKLKAGLRALTKRGAIVPN